MSIRNRLMANRFGYDSQYTQMEAVSDYIYRGRDYYAQPDMEKRFLRTRSDFNTILSIAKENYVGTEDPDSYEARMALGQIIHQLYPAIDAQYAAENAEDLMYYATGYKTDVKGLRDQFVNTFHSAGSSLLASMKIANLYIQGAFAGYDDETWIEKKKEAKKDLSRYAMNYRTDLTEYDNAISRLLSEPVTATAEMLPSMLPSLGISAIAAAISVATGGAAIPATTAGLIKAWNTLSGVQKATAAASIGGRFTTSALMEMGGSALDMMNAGFDDDVIFGVSSLVGLTNGVLETVGDKAIDVALKPFTELADAAGRKTANKIIRTSIRDTIKEMAGDTGKSILSESTTEVLQEFSSMFGYNMAVNIQKERGNLPEEIRAYTAQDFRDAAFEVAKSTAMGTAVLGAGSGLLRFAGRFAGGELRRSLQADKYTKADGATARIATSNIDYENTTIAPDQDIERQGPISVVRIGDRYRAMHTTDEERAAISRSRQVYVREVDYSTETAIGKKVDFDTVDMHSPVKRSVVESVINSGMSNGKIAGFTYYNENLARVADPSKAAYISLVESSDSDPIMIPLSEESNVSAVQLQKDIYGETIDKVSPAPEPEENPGTSSEGSAEESEATETEPEIIQDEDEAAEDVDTFTEEELSEAESAIDELENAEEPAETISTEDTESETVIQENGESVETALPEGEAIVQENTSESEAALLETEGMAAEIPMQENAPETQAETTEEAPAQIAGADTVQDTRTPEEIRADEDTARRNERNQARINAQNEWDQVQRMLTGTDSAKDVDVLTVYFSSILGQTRLGESAPAVEASARAAAEIAVGFARASGLKGKDYYNTINAFMSEDFIPDIENGTVYFQPAYHGAAANFDKFSTEYVGSGEGSQAFGFGLYFTMNETVARKYGTVATERKKRSKSRRSNSLLGAFGGRVEVDRVGKAKSILKKYLISNGIITEAQWKNAYNTMSNSVLEEIELDETTELFKDKSSLINIFNNYAKSVASDSWPYRDKDKKIYSKYGNQYVDILNNLPDELVNELKEVFNIGIRNLYTVEIPDGNFIKWYEPVPEDVLDAINKDNIALISNNGNPYEAEGKNFGQLYKEVSWNITNNSGIRGDQYLSNALHRNGYSGIVYPIGTLRGGYDPNATEMNYVVFNDNDVKITDHIFFSELDNKEKLGWFLRDNGERYINIMRNADPSTLIHELGHHFLSVLTPDMPAYNLIHEVYAKAIERDGGIIGKDTNEAFARDLEKYVYFRKSSNSRLNAIFQKLYDVAKALWQTLKGDERLSSQKVKMFDAIFAEEQTPEAVSAEVAKSADKAMSSDSDTKMSDMAAELVSETAESAEETPEAVNAQAEYVIDSIDNEAAEVLRDISVDYVPDAEPDPIPEGADTIDVPQTEEEIAAEEPVQIEIVEPSEQDEGLNYAIDIDIDEIDADPKKFYKKRLNAGKVDSKAIEKQIKSKNNQKYFDEISAQYDVDSPIVGMASTANIYKAISGITGVSDLDTAFAEFFYAKDGGIYVLLKKDIRVSSEDETTAFLQDKPEPKFWKIPFSGNDISVDDIAYEYYIDNLPEVVEREYTTDADGNIIYREDAEAAPTEAEDIADQDEYDITEEDSEDEGGYEIERRVKNTFTGYSDPFVTALSFARSYESKPELYFSSNNTEAIREAADLIEGSLSSTTLANSYRRFTKYIEEVKKKAEKEFNDEHGDSEDLKQERADYIWAEVAKELQLDDVDASEAEQFAGYLKITEKAGIMDKMPGIPYDMRDDVILTVARDLINTSKSYLTNGKILRDGISNPKLFNNAVKLLRSLVESMSKSNNVTQVRDSIASMLRNDKAANALDTDKPIAGIWLDVYTAFQKNRNTGNVTEDKIRTLIEALVDENGTPRFVTQTRDGLHLTSPLIVLSNFYSSSGEGANRSNDSFTVASEAYLDIAQKQIRERINPDDAKDAAASSFINLFTMARNKFGNEFLNTYFGSRISMSKADALLAAMSKRVDALKKQAQEVRDNPETERQLKESDKNIAGLQRTIERLQKALDDSKGNISELKKQIRNQAKDNETMLEWLSEIDDLGSIEEAQARINDLVSQYDALQRKHDRMIAAKDSKIAELKKRIDYLLTHAPELKTAKEIRDQLDDIIKAIRNRADKGNARVAVQLKEILDFLMSDTSKDVRYDPNIFQARWSEYNGYYNMLRYFVESRMVKDGYLVSSMASLDLQDLAQLDDIVTNIVGFGVDEMNYRKMQEDTKWARRMTYALRGIPKFSDLEFNHEAMDKLIDELEKGNVPGSVESRIESGAVSGLISEFTQIDNALKAINPALHNIIFGGGLVEGERISDNLNSAQEQYVKMVDERQHKVAEKFAEIFKPSDFGLNVKGNKFSPEDFMIYQERAFRNEHVKIGNMTLEEFQAKHGSFGKITQKGAVFTGQVSAKPGTMWYELSRRILSEELQYRRNQIKFKKNPSDLAEMNERYRKIMSGELTNTFTMENLMEIYKLAMQKDGLNRLIIAPESDIATNNLSIENILWVVDNLSEGGSLSNYGRFAEALQKIEAERYPDLSEVYYLMENEILPEIDFYSAIRDDRSVAEEVNQKDLRINASENERSSLDTSFIKERTNPKRAADLNGISIAMNAIRDQEKYISQAILIKKYSEMFKKNGALDLALEKAYGTDGKLLSSSLRKWLGQIIDENNRTPRTRTENTIAKLRSNMVRSVLWAAPSVIMQQFPTYILVARRIGMRNATAQLFSTISNRKGVAQFVYSKSKQMKDRARIETAEYRQRAGEFAKDPIFLEKLKRDGYSRRALRGREQFERFIRWGMDLQQKVDTAVANSMWLALYNHYSATMERGNLSDADFDAMVSERATQEVLSIQPSQYAKDNALAYNSRSEALKSFLLFTSSLNKEFNMIFEDYLSGRFNGFTREKIGNLIESFMYISLVSLAISFISGRQWPDDDDDRELKATLSRMAKGTMSESFGIIPGIGRILSDVVTGEVYYDTGTAGTIFNLIKVLAKNPEDRREGQLANAISKSFVEAFQLTGIPSNTPMKVYDAITELNPGELVNSQWADFYSYIRD